MIAQLIAAIGWKGIDLSGSTPVIRRLGSDDLDTEELVSSVAQRCGRS